MTFVELSAALPLIRANKVRALGVGSEKRKSVLPDVPAVAVAKRLADMNVDAVGSTPGEMAQFMKEESERWGNIIRITGTKAE